MHYSKRITAIIDILKPGNILADIGCDHGYVAIGAANTHKFNHIIASDIAAGPLSKAEEAVHLAGLDNMIELRLSNGFQNINEPFDTVDICGMGGLLIRKILMEQPEKLTQVKQLVLGPHSEIPALRRSIYQMDHFQIEQETMIKEAGKFYVLFDVRNTVQSYKASPEDIIFEYGDPSLQTDKLTYAEFLEDQLCKSNTILSGLSEIHSEHSRDTIRSFEEKTDRITSLLRKINDHSGVAQ